MRNLKGVVVYCLNVDYHRQWASRYADIVKETTNKPDIAAQKVNELISNALSQNNQN
jgi:hypothetical protein